MKQKLSEDSVLKDLDSKKVHDKVRSLYRFSRPVKLSLPKEKEDLLQKIQCFQRSAVESTTEISTHDFDSDDDLFILPSTTSKKDLFGKKEIKLVNDGFGDIIKGKSVKDELMRKAIERNPCAKKLADTMSYDMIKNRIKI